jgi:membrane peptidoglycan carboxypeptidase
MKKSAAVVAGAKEFKHAATATAMVISYCGTCHTAAKVALAVPEAAKPAAPEALAAHMLEHQWATELLYQGLVRSCDVYHYQLGLKLGVDRMAEYARRLGYGSRTLIGLSNESRGLVPSSQWS